MLTILCMGLPITTTIASILYIGVPYTTSPIIGIVKDLSIKEVTKG